MKIQSLLLAIAAASACAGAAAQEKPAADKAAAAAAARDAIVKRAEALSEDQIKKTHDIAALTRLAQIFNAKNDTQRLIWVLQRVGELMPNSGDLKLQLALV